MYITLTRLFVCALLHKRARCCYTKIHHTEWVIEGGNPKRLHAHRSLSNHLRRRTWIYNSLTFLFCHISAKYITSTSIFATFGDSVKHLIRSLFVCQQHHFWYSDHVYNTQYTRRHVIYRCLYIYGTCYNNHFYLFYYKSIEYIIII